MNKINSVSSNDAFKPLGKAPKFIGHTGVPRCMVGSTEEGVDGFLFALAVVDMIDMRMEGPDSLQMLERVLGQAGLANGITLLRLGWHVMRQVVHPWKGDRRRWLFLGGNLYRCRWNAWGRSHWRVYW
jgi:hypothetical protein